MLLHRRIDNLPASRRMTLDGKTKHYKGFPVGFVGATHGFDAGYINNHLQLTIKYHKVRAFSLTRLSLFVVSN